MSMKISRFIVFTLVLLLVLTVPAVVLAEQPEPTDTPAATDDTSATEAQPDFEIIKLASSGSDVLRIQLRLADLGYLCYRATGQFGKMTRDSVISFQQDNSLMSDGSIGAESFAKLFENGLPRVKIAPNIPNKSGPPLAGTPQKLGEEGDWSTEILPKLTAGAVLKITDFNSNATFYMKFTGGKNHAEVEAATDADNQKFLKAFGGQRNFEKRSVLVTIDGTDYAASLFGWLHGDNDRQTCLYFSGSLSHVADLPDSEHESMVKRAAGN